jgi:hypothetical protein
MKNIAKSAGWQQNKNDQGGRCVDTEKLREI